MAFSATAKAQGQFAAFTNHSHSAEALPFADLSQHIWDLMAAKDSSITARPKSMVWM